MVSVLIGWMVVGLIALVMAAGLWAGWARSSSRDPHTLVVTTKVHGEAATIVRGRISLLPGAVVTGYLALFLLMLGLTVGSGLGLVPFLLLVGWLALAAYFMGSGRVGYRTMVLTPERLTQRDAGVEQSVRWADITSVEPNQQGLDLLADAVEVRRLVPALWTGRTRRPRQGVSVQLGDLHPHMDLTRSLLTWIDEPWRRAELGTPEAVDRLIGPR